MIHDSPAVRMLNETVRYGGLLVRRGDMFLDLEAQKVTGPAMLRYGDLPAVPEEIEFRFNPATGEFERVRGDGETPCRPCPECEGEVSMCPEYDEGPVAIDVPVCEDCGHVVPPDPAPSSVDGLCCPLHDDVHDGRHWWLKPGMSAETAEAICRTVTGMGGNRGWRQEAPFSTRVAKANRKIVGAHLRAALKVPKDAVPSPHFRFTFHVEHDPARVAKATADLYKMGVQGTQLTFPAREMEAAPCSE